MHNEINDKIKLALKSFFEMDWRQIDFLTEDDVRCQLFSYLKSYFDSNNNLSIHSEVRWYGGMGSKKLKYRSDIVIINPTGLRLEEKFSISPKSYVFERYYSLIEIKLRRKNNRNSDKTYETNYILEDIRKVKEIFQSTSTNSKINCIIVFDQKRDRKLLKFIDSSTSDSLHSLEWETWQN